MDKNKTAKYKITDTDIDKKIIGKQVTVEKVKAKGGPGGGRKPPKPRQAPSWFNDFITNRFSKLEKDVSNLNNRLDRVIKINNLKE